MRAAKPAFLANVVCTNNVGIRKER
jgi:hypothetical protein